ncbi:hypothetical protein BDV59DRAFT_195916 [Aspergillus ambiguus]|uniref:uncharacterized protein n=1 Tax=Aspergillus ambiguus TaxID=176160 RepID=UPI003CCD6627
MSHTPARQQVNTPSPRRFRCDQCNKNYSKFEHLSRHRRTHTQTKPFKCAHCGKCFGRQDVLNRHTRLHTQASPREDQTVPTAEAIGTCSQSQQTPQEPVLDDRLFPDGSSIEQLPSINPGAQEPEDLLSWLLSDRYDSVPLPMVDFLEPWNNLNVNAIAPPADQDVRRTAVPQMYNLIEELSRRLSSDFHSEGITTSFLDACLHEFFTHCLPCFPVIHKPTFSSSKCIPPLLLNMVALGSLFLCLPRARQKGEMLWRLGHTVVATSWQTLISVRGARDDRDGVQLVLTALLGQTYALLSSNTSIRSTAFVFHGLGFYWARIRGMYSINESPSQLLPGLDAFTSEKNAAWESWAAAEVQRRAILGHYILDGLIAQASGSPPSARHLINRLGAACSDTAFSAETADDWILEMKRSTCTRLSFSEIFDCVFSPRYQNEPLQLSRVSAAVVLEGLDSLVSELEEAGKPSVGVVCRQQIIQALINIYQGNISPDADADAGTTIRWHAVCLDASTPLNMLCNAICREFDVPQLLGGTPADGCSRPWDLHGWGKSADAVRAVLHALAINKLLKKVAFARAHSIYLPSTIFSSAVTLSAFCLLERSALEVPQSPQWRSVWESVLAGDLDSQRNSADASGEALLHCLYTSHGVMTTEDLLSEINFLQICLKTVGSPWGVSEQMENMISRMAMLARARHSSPI